MRKVIPVHNAWTRIRIYGVPMGLNYLKSRQSYFFKIKFISTNFCNFIHFIELFFSSFEPNIATLFGLIEKRKEKGECSSTSQK